MRHYMQLPPDFVRFVPLQIDSTLCLRAVAVSDATALAGFFEAKRARLAEFLSALTNEIDAPRVQQVLGMDL